MSVVRPAYTELLCNVGLEETFRFACLSDKSTALYNDIFLVDPLMFLRGIMSFGTMLV